MKSRKTIVFLFAAGVILLVCGISWADTFDAHFKKGLELAADSEFESAEAELNIALSMDNSDPDVNSALSMLEEVKNGTMTKEYAADFFQGFLYSLEGDYERALAALEKARAIDPNDADVNYNLGNVYYSLQNYPKAIDHLQDALRLHGDDAQAYQLIGNAYYYLGQYREATENLLKARELFQRLNEQDGIAEIDTFLAKMAFVDSKDR